MILQRILQMNARSKVDKIRQSFHGARKTINLRLNKWMNDEDIIIYRNKKLIWSGLWQMFTTSANGRFSSTGQNKYWVFDCQFWQVIHSCMFGTTQLYFPLSLNSHPMKLSKCSYKGIKYCYDLSGFFFFKIYIPFKK